MEHGIGAAGVSVALYAVAYATGVAAFALMARRRGLATDGVAILSLAALAGGVFGAQAFQLLLGGVPGRSLLGGVAGGYLAVVYAKQRLGIRRPTGDLFAVAVAGGETIGRIGCFFAGCCFGKPSALPWAVYQHDAWRHPTQLYSALAAAATLALLIVLERRRALPENGLFYVQGLLLCAFRFAIEYARAGPSGPLGLTIAQLVCAGGCAFFAWRLARVLHCPAGAHSGRLAAS